jgi:cysteine desulfurase family protein (TIGR01976 family)
MITPLDLPQIRAQFPGLARQVNGQPAIFTDGPAGSQVPRSVAEAISHYLLHQNANHGGIFATSIESDELLHKVHEQAAAFFGVTDPDTIIFGNNMTSLSFAVSRAIARNWHAGDEIILSRCDHDANVTPWVLAAQDKGVNVRWIEINKPDCTLNLETLDKQLSSRTKLVAVGMASNAVGTVHPVREIADKAHRVGAMVFLDAVHYAAHQLIDAPATGADFIACSAYKFFGPHVGLLWGKREYWEKLTPYKVRPATETLPGRWMTGTQNHEGIAGVGAAIEYLASLATVGSTLRERLQNAFERIAAHEYSLSNVFLQGLSVMDDYQLFGQPTVQGRVSTFGIKQRQFDAELVSTLLAQQGIFTWSGNFYALPLTEALNLEPHGLVRIGFLHYNTLQRSGTGSGGVAISEVK